MKYSELRTLMEQYEAWQRMKLRQEMPGRIGNHALCNGQVQFASIENVTEQSPDCLRAPIVVCIGINYTQNPNLLPPHSPYLPNPPSGLSIVEDYSSQMRDVLNETFAAYESNPSLWVDRNLAPHGSIPIPPIPRNYFLVATNFSPFITFQEWQNYDSADRAQVLAAVGGQMQHLDDLLAILGKEEVLWVGHGLLSEVFSLFRLWQMRNAVSKWLLTANLSGRNRGKIHAPNGQTRFWNRQRPGEPDLSIRSVLEGPVDE